MVQSKKPDIQGPTSIGGENGVYPGAQPLGREM